MTNEREIPCNQHPAAPHGFNRNASHNAGRYVCDCEGWTLNDMGIERAANLLNEIIEQNNGTPSEMACDHVHALLAALRHDGSEK